MTTLQDTTPPTAPELTGFVRSHSQVALTWTASTDDITWWTLGYRIFADGVPVTEHVNWNWERQVVLRHLTPDTTYTFTVEANDFNGNKTMSNLGAGIDRDFVYGTASENTFTVKAVDHAGNTSAASDAATDVC